MNAASETPAERVVRVQRWVADTARCRRCGERRINILHEPDPDNAPEGREYYAALRDRLHSFVL